MSEANEAQWDFWLSEIHENGVNLTTWEADFVESIVSQRERGRKLSDKQVEILERIYAEKTP
jgi:hypothetical protein